MSTIALYDNYTGSAAGTAKTIEARASLFRVTVSASSHGTTVIQIQDPAGNWISIPNASSTTDDSYELSLYPGDIVRANVTSGSVSGAYVYLRAIGSR